MEAIMNIFPRNIPWIKIARSTGDMAAFALEAYKAVLSAQYYAAETAVKAVKAYDNATSFISSKLAVKENRKPVPADPLNENKNDKENFTMKKTCILGVVAFLAAVAGALVAVALYLKKKEQNLAEYEEMLYSEDYLSDYMPKEECDCCCEEAEEEFCCEEEAEDTCCCEEPCQE